MIVVAKQINRSQYLFRMIRLKYFLNSKDEDESSEEEDDDKSKLIRSLLFVFFIGIYQNIKLRHVKYKLQNTFYH